MLITYKPHIKFKWQNKNNYNYNSLLMDTQNKKDKNCDTKNVKTWAGIREEEIKCGASEYV